MQGHCFWERFFQQQLNNEEAFPTGVFCRGPICPEDVFSYIRITIEGSEVDIHSLSIVLEDKRNLYQKLNFYVGKRSKNYNFYQEIDI
jgi:hypothetical protein